MFHRGGADSGKLKDNEYQHEVDKNFKPILKYIGEFVIKHKLVNYGATAVTEGQEIYMSLCQACHGADGKGNDGMAANFVDDKSILAKSDIELLDVIANGKGTMPAWGVILQPWQQISVLQHIRQTYGDAL